MGVLQDTIRHGASAAGTYEIDRSLRFNRADSANLTWTPSSAGNRQKWTFSCWIKRTTLHTVHGGYEGIFGTGTFTTGSTWGGIYLDNLEAIYLFDGSVSTLAVTPKYKLRDLSAWYHIVAVCNLTDSSSKIYINGDVQTDMTTNWQGSVTDGNVNNTTVHYLGRDSAGNYFDGYLAECHFVDGSALEAADFGKTDPVTGQWVAKEYTGTHGTNGFYVNFKDNSNTTATTLGKDNSANSNNWTPNNLSVSAGIGNDSFEDTPTNNFPTLNRTYPNTSSGTLAANTFTNGCLQFADAGGYGAAPATMSIKNDKYYWEVTAGAGVQIHGIIRGTNMGSGSYVGYCTNDKVHGYSWQGNGHIYGESGTGTYEGTTLTTGQTTYADTDVIGFASDIPNGTLKFYKGDPSDSDNLVYTITGINSDDWFPAVSTYGANICNINFGQRAFTHTPPTGYKKLCAANLKAPTIKKGKQYFNTVIYEGDITDNSGSATQTEDGVGFQADLTWIKRRDAANSNQLVDSIRGAGKWLETNADKAQETSNTNGVLTSWNSDGFVLTGGTTNANLCCEDGFTYAAWNWKESALAGFDIVTHNMDTADTDTSISHGLNITPEFIIAKNIDGSDNSWRIYHHKFSATPTSNNLYLGTPSVGTNSLASSSSRVKAVSDSAFTYNANVTGNFIFYLWNSVEGYSKAGIYSGNGNADGSFIYTGFKPAWIIAKRYDSTSSWQIWDNVRDTDNPVTHRLRADLNNLEDTGQVDIDFCATGWKLRNTGINQTNGDYIYMAFAETPSNYATAR